MKNIVIFHKKRPIELKLKGSKNKLILELISFKTYQNKLSEREHVTPFIRNNSDLKSGNLFSAISYKNNTDYSSIRMTVDEQKDFELINKIISDLGSEQSWLYYTEYIIKNDLANINGNIIRNEGYLKSLKKD